MNELTLRALGKGGIDPNTAVQVEGISYNDGVFSVDVSVLDADTPYAWIKVNPNDVTEDEVDSWHWGLFEDATSDVDLWGGIFHGDTLAQCGNAIGLDTTDLVDGRVLKMWAEKDNAVAYEVSAELDVSGTPTPTKVLTGLSGSGSIDEDLQFAGEAPNLTGYTFTASYSDGSSATIDNSNIVVTPSVYENGNPNNLGTASLSFSYTEDGVTVTTEGPTIRIHRRATGQVLNMNQAGFVYFDLDTGMREAIIQAGSLWGPAALFESRTASPGDLAFGVFPDEEYNDPTKVVDAAKLGSWMPLYGLGSQGETFHHIGTPNTPGYVPGYGVNWNNTATEQPYDLNDCNVAIRTDGTATMSAGDEVVHLVVGVLASGITNSYNIGNWDLQNSVHYSCICRKS